MTARQIWEGMLTELSKVNAPSMLLPDFNYFLNKAVNQYINKRYNIYDISQQTTDDLRVLKATSVLGVNKVTETEDPFKGVGTAIGSANLLGATYEVNLPDDYLHILNCICVYEVRKNFKCYDVGNYVQFAAKRLTADSWSTILNDYYNRPLPWRPYYYIHNVNINKGDLTPTNPREGEIGTDIKQSYSYQTADTKTTYRLISGLTVYYPYGNSTTGIAADTLIIIKDGKTYVDRDGSEVEVLDNSTRAPIELSKLKRIVEINPSSLDSYSNFEREMPIRSGLVDRVEKETAQRYGNPSKVRMEIRFGRDDSVFRLTHVFVDYVKTPQFIRLTQEQVDLTEDTSLIMEFPDYVCQEIINELTMLVMENTADPRLPSNTQVTQSIANPAQQLIPQSQPQALQRG